MRHILSVFALCVGLLSLVSCGGEEQSNIPEELLTMDVLELMAMDNPLQPVDVPYPFSLMVCDKYFVPLSCDAEGEELCLGWQYEWTDTLDRLDVVIDRELTSGRASIQAHHIRIEIDNAKAVPTASIPFDNHDDANNWVVIRMSQGDYDNEAETCHWFMPEPTYPIKV